MKRTAQFIAHKPSIMLFCMAFLAVRVSAQSQKGDKEIAVSYGFLSGTESVIESLGYGIYQDGSYTQKAHSGNYFGTFRWYAEDNLAFGFTAGLQTLGYIYTNTGTKFSFPSYSMNATVGTVAFEVKKEYFHKNNDEMENESAHFFQFYGLGGLGARYFDEVQSPHTSSHSLPPVFINMQCSPLCVRAGNAFGCFAELGFGYKGIANLGCSYRITPKRRNLYHMN